MPPMNDYFVITLIPPVHAASLTIEVLDAEPHQAEAQQCRQARHGSLLAGDDDPTGRRRWWQILRRRWPAPRWRWGIGPIVQVLIFRSSVSNGHRFLELGGREKNGRRAASGLLHLNHRGWRAHFS